MTGYLSSKAAVFFNESSIMNNHNPKDSNINYYNDNAQAFIKQTFSLDMQLLYEPFIASLPATAQSQQRIFDADQVETVYILHS